MGRASRLRKRRLDPKVANVTRSVSNKLLQSIVISLAIMCAVAKGGRFALLSDMPTC